MKRLSKILLILCIFISSFNIFVFADSTKLCDYYIQYSTNNSSTNIYYFNSYKISNNQIVMNNAYLYTLDSDSNKIVKSSGMSNVYVSLSFLDFTYFDTNHLEIYDYFYVNYSCSDDYSSNIAIVPVPLYSPVNTGDEIIVDVSSPSDTPDNNLGGNSDNSTNGDSNSDSDTSSDYSGFFGGILEMLELVISTITGLVTSIIDGLKNLFIDLFVPDENYFSDVLTELNDLFYAKFPVFEELKNLLNNVFVDKTSVKPIFSITYMGTKYELDIFNGFESYIDIFKNIVSCYIWLHFIFRTYKRLPSIVQGG